MKHEERQIWLLNEYPEAGLKLIEKGEPVCPALVESLYAKNPELLEKILQLDFEIYCESSSSRRGAESEKEKLYLTLCRIYGEWQFRQKILSQPNLWRNFLRFIPLRDMERGAFVNKLLDEHAYAKAYKFVKCAPMNIFSDVALRDKFFAEAQRHFTPNGELDVI